MINTKTKQVNIPVKRKYREKLISQLTLLALTDNLKHNVSSQYLKQKAQDGIKKGLNKLFDKEDVPKSREQNAPQQQKDRRSGRR